MLEGKAGGSQGQEEPETFLAAVEPYREPLGFGQTPAGMLGLAADLLAAAAGDELGVLALHSSFRGDCALGALMPGGPYNVHENAVAAIKAFKSAFAAMGDAYELKWIDIIQGEGGPFIDYGALLKHYIENIIPLFSAAADQEYLPKVIFSQINSFTNAVQVNNVALEQYEAARVLLDDGSAFLAGPMYHLPFHDPGHLTDAARMMHGEMRALVRHYLIDLNESWNPLWPDGSAVALEGRLIRVPMRLPPGASHLCFDDDWIPAVPGKGFLFQDASGAQCIIENVRLDDHVVSILLESPPAAGGTLSYATFNGPGVEWWASGRGHLFAETGIPSPFAALSFDVPRTIRHYCVTFSLPVVPGQEAGD